MTPTYYLVRHAQTEWNAEGRSQGRQDSPLTELGLEQARQHARTLAEIPFARAYVSPMGRAQRTAEIILEGRNIPMTVLDDLAELDHGEITGLLKSERKNTHPDFVKARKKDKYGTPNPGGESYETASPRAKRALERIQADNNEGSVLIVSHSQLGRLLRMHLLDIKPKQAMKTHQPHDTIYRIKSGKVATSTAGGPFKH